MFQPMDVVGTVGFVGQSLLAGDVLHALPDQGFGLGMQSRETPSALPAHWRVVVVRGRADPPHEKHTLPEAKARCSVAVIRWGEIAHIFGPGELQAAGGEQFDGLGHVLVGALARQDLVAHDHQPENRALQTEGKFGVIWPMLTGGWGGDGTGGAAADSALRISSGRQAIVGETTGRRRQNTSRGKSRSATEGGMTRPHANEGGPRARRCWGAAPR